MAQDITIKTLMTMTPEDSIGAACWSNTLLHADMLHGPNCRMWEGDGVVRLGSLDTLLMREIRGSMHEGDTTPGKTY